MFFHLPTAGQTGGSFPFSTRQSRTIPKIFGEGIFSTREYELTTAFTPDGKMAFFTLSTPSYGKKHTILFSKFQNGRWTTSEVAPFSGFWSDADPFISPDGNQLYFISNRPSEGRVPKNDFDIFVVEKKGNGWSEPRNIGKPINSERNELYVTLTKDKTIYFVSSRPDSRGQGDIYRSRFINGQYAEPENLGEKINTTSHDTTAFIAPDESYLIFSSNKQEGFGDFDLYISFNLNGNWTKAVNLGERINTKAREYCPLVSPDGKYLFFSSDRGFTDSMPEKALSYSELMKNLNSPLNGLGNVYQVDLAQFLKLKNSD